MRIREPAIRGSAAPSDAAVEQVIRHRIIGQVLAIEEDRIWVEVSEGHVHLTGWVQARTEAALLEELIACVDGVLSVRCDLGFLVDDTGHQDETGSPGYHPTHP